MPSSDLEKFIGSPLPSSIASIYTELDAIDDDHDLMRLLPQSEAVETNKAIRAFYTDLNPDLLLLWTDDNSNYAGAYVRGDLAPRVALLNHDEPDDTPVFFGVESFQAARQHGSEHRLAWYELPTDYPVVSVTEYALLEADRALGLEYLEIYQSHPDGNRHFAFYALNLVPPTENSFLCKLLFSEDMWVQERACQVVGRRKYEAAVNDLERVARDGSHNGRLAALIALKTIGTREARTKLKALAKELGSDFLPYLR